jgi:hypothetical protein
LNPYFAAEWFFFFWRYPPLNFLSSSREIHSTASDEDPSLISLSPSLLRCLLGKTSLRISDRSLRNQFPTQTILVSLCLRAVEEEGEAVTGSQTSPITGMRCVLGNEEGGEAVSSIGARKGSHGAVPGVGSLMFGVKERFATALRDGEGVVETPFPHQPIIRVMREVGGIERIESVRQSSCCDSRHD